MRAFRSAPEQRRFRPARQTARRSALAVLALGAATLPALAESPEPTTGLSHRVMAAMDALSAAVSRVAADVAAAPVTLAGAVTRATPSGGSGWILTALGAAAVAILLGWAVERISRPRPGRAYLARQPAPDAPRARLIGHVLLSLLIDVLLLAAGLAAGMLVAARIVDGVVAVRELALSIVEPYAIARLVLILLRGVLGSGTGAARLLPLAEADVAAVLGPFARHIVPVVLLTAVWLWFGRLPVAPGLTALAGVLTVTAFGAALAGVVLRIRQALGPNRPSGRGLGARLGRNWHRIVLGYLAVAVGVTALAQLLGRDVQGLVGAPLGAIGLALFVQGAGLILIDAVFPPAAPTGGRPLPSYAAWAEGTLFMAALAAGAAVMLATWGVGFLREDGTVRAVWSILLVLILARSGWAAVDIAFARQLAAESGEEQTALDEDAEGGPGRSRLATLLPLFRNAVFIVILVMVAMIVLSAIGVDVAPLFAGAGIVGIAVGFGSQALVRDVFSGFFFLIDDAFRVGEYIETGSAKGTVEKISIRSMQLRHQNGPLHTIPFGEISQLTNFSRDWVITKLPVKVWFGTDTEKVRKLIKKLGVELLTHPEIGAKFVEPLKSQGVYSIEDNGIVIRMKFRCRPGDQFAIRKVVWQRINEIFAREGIRFGGRDVLVNLSPDEAPAAATAAVPATGAEKG